MATKHTDTCLQKAGDDEPIFVLRAQDRLAPMAVRAWIHNLIDCGGPQAKIDEAKELLDKMLIWQAGHRTKFPD